MGILEFSKQLSSDNKEIELFIRKLRYYIFSPEIRKILFGYGQKSEDEIALINTRLEECIIKIRDLKENVKKYNEQMQYMVDSYLIHQVHERGLFGKLAEKFTHNAITNTKRILWTVKKIRKYVKTAERTNKPEENQALSHKIKDELILALDMIKENGVLLADIQGRVQAEKNLIYNFKELKKRLIRKNDLKTGDIMLSFKTKKYLGQLTKFMDLLISKVIKSQITHSRIAARIGPGNVKMIEDTMMYSRVFFSKFKVKPGEIFIILRPRISRVQRSALIKSMIKHVKNKTPYAWGKVTAAIPTVAITKIANLFRKEYKHVSNIWGRSKSLHCSEFIDVVFQDAGIMLTPKSKPGYSATVYPHDILNSPYVRHIGFIFDTSKKSEKMIIKEYMDQIA
jgi:hypothetical protein